MNRHGDRRKITEQHLRIFETIKYRMNPTPNRNLASLGTTYQIDNCNVGSLFEDGGLFGHTIIESVDSISRDDLETT